MDIGSLLFPNAPAYAPGLLGEEEAAKLQNQARQSGLLNIGLGLLSAGSPSPVRTGLGQGLAQGLMAGQQAYQQVYAQRLQEMELARKIAEQRRQEQLRTMAGSIIQPTTTAGTPAQFSETSDGNLQIGQMPVAGKTSFQIDPQRLMAMAALSDQPLASLKTVPEIIRGLQQVGLAPGGMQQDNPFEVFTVDPSLPQSLRSVAQQYAQSYASGVLPPDKIDERIRQLGEAAQRAATTSESMKLREQQMQQSLDLAKSQQELTGSIARSQQDISKQMVDLRREQFEAQQQALNEKRQEQEKIKEDSKSQLDTTLRQLKKNYDTLLQQGGIVSTEASGAENIAARASASTSGRAMGAAVGTKTEQQRQTIEQTRPLLLNLIKNATGMSAQQMNSNAEMQLYLRAATDPSLSYEANLDAMANLDRLFGTGELAKDIEKQLQSTKARTGRSKW